MSTEETLSPLKLLLVMVFVIATENKERQTRGTLLEHLCDMPMAFPDRAISVSKTNATVSDGAVLDVTSHFLLSAL